MIKLQQACLSERLSRTTSFDCRINLIGGGEAQGLATDTAAVFTPGEAAQNQIFLYNMTLPHGFFSQAPPGTTTRLGTVESELQL